MCLGVGGCVWVLVGVSGVLVDVSVNLVRCVWVLVGVSVNLGGCVWVLVGVSGCWWVCL